jgi:hypothetical protein
MAKSNEDQTTIPVVFADNMSTMTVRARGAFDLTGTVTSTDNSATVTGTGTAFLTEVAVGDMISAGGGFDGTKGVVAIASNTSLTVDSPFIYGTVGMTAQIIPSTIRFDDASGNPQFSVNGQGCVGIGTTGGRGQLEVWGTGAGNYFGCPVGVRIHNSQSSDAWQLVLSAEGGDFQPGALLWTTADGNNDANFTISLFDGDELHAAVDMVRIDTAGLHLLTGLSTTVNEIAANYTVDLQAQYVVADAGSTGITITLPQASGCGGRMLTLVKAAGAGDLTIAAHAGDFINAATTKVISTAYSGLQLVSTGGNVWIAHVMTAA